MLSKSLLTTMHRKKYCLILSYYSWDNIPQAKTLCNFTQEAPDKIATGKNTVHSCFNTLGTKLHRKNPMSCCPWDFRQHFTRKILFNVVYIFMGQHCTDCTDKYVLQCCPKGSRQHWTRKNSFECCLNSFRTKSRSWKPWAMLPKRLQIILHRPVNCRLSNITFLRFL